MKKTKQTMKMIYKIQGKENISLPQVLEALGNTFPRQRGSIEFEMAMMRMLDMKNTNVIQHFGPTATPNFLIAKKPFS